MLAWRDDTTVADARPERSFLIFPPAQLFPGGIGRPPPSLALIGSLELDDQQVPESPS